MDGMEPEIGSVVVPTTDISALQESFRVFNQVTKNLEQAYARLENRASGVEDRLQVANDRLRAKVSQLKSVTDELNGILESIPCGVVACDGEGSISRVNAAAERIIGRPAGELRGRDVRTLRDHRGRPILLMGDDRVPVGSIQERLVCGLDGSERHISGSVVDMPDAGRLEVLSDQTEVVHLRSQINRLDTLAELGEMAAGVAHEIRNPMSAVEGFAGLLERSVRNGESIDGEVLRRYSDRIRRGVAAVNGIITNLLIWARPEPARMDRVDLLGLIREELQESPLRPVPDIKLHGETGSFGISGDRLKLKLAVSNLVRNATEAAGPDGQVVVSLTAMGESVRLRVEDNGPGIAPTMRARLFRPFSTNKPSGTGLGLALVRKFAELHGGSVVAGGSDLGGARFDVTLPVCRKGAMS